MMKYVGYGLIAIGALLSFSLFLSAFKMADVNTVVPYAQVGMIVMVIGFIITINVIIRNEKKDKK